MGGGGDQETTQRSEPWSAAKPFLRDVMREAQGAYRGGELGAVGEQSPWEQMGLQQGADLAMGGGFGLVPGAQGLGQDVLSGQYLTGETNPYFQDAISYAQQPVIDAWNQQIKPGIDATFANTAGGLGSGAYAAKVAQGGDALARNLAGAATQAGAGNYARERGLQQQTMGLSPGLEGAGYGTAEQLLRYGGLDTARGQFEAGAPERGLQSYAGLIGGMPQFGTTTSQQSSSSNPFLQALGIGATGVGLAGGLGWQPFG